MILCRQRNARRISRARKCLVRNDRKWFALTRWWREVDLNRRGPPFRDTYPN
jgi:hypothetical protein